MTPASLSFSLSAIKGNPALASARAICVASMAGGVTAKEVSEAVARLGLLSEVGAPKMPFLGVLHQIRSNHPRLILCPQEAFSLEVQSSPSTTQVALPLSNLTPCSASIQA